MGGRTTESPLTDSDGGGSGRVSWGPFSVDLVGGFVQINDELIELQPLQLRILGLLVLNAGSVVTKAALRERIFRVRQADSNTSIERQISVLRTRLGSARSMLTTVPGVGYAIGLREKHGASARLDPAVATAPPISGPALEPPSQRNRPPRLPAPQQGSDG